MIADAVTGSFAATLRGVCQHCKGDKEVIVDSFFDGDGDVPIMGPCFACGGAGTDVPVFDLDYQELELVLPYPHMHPLRPHGTCSCKPCLLRIKAERNVAASLKNDKGVLALGGCAKTPSVAPR